jgi:hypothetical protein
VRNIAHETLKDGEDRLDKRPAGEAGAKYIDSNKKK